MTEREALKLALEALESKYIVNWGARHVQQDQAITAIREALAQPEHSPDCALLKIPSKDCDCQDQQEPVAWETFALKFANGKGLSYEKPKNLPKYLACRPLIYQPAPTSDTSKKRVDETAKHQHEKEPVIDKSAAVRIATALGWEPKRKPLTDEDLETMAEKYVTNCYFDTLKYARAIEAAHGIKE
jgi:hypothetical protein